MKIDVSCPGCQNSGPVDAAVLDKHKKLRCPSCNLIFRPQRPREDTAVAEQHQPIPVAELHNRETAAPASAAVNPGSYWSTAGSIAEPAELSRAEQYALVKDHQKRPATAIETKGGIDDFAKGMSNLGFYFLGLGIIAAVLPLFGLQLRRLQGLSSYGLFAGLPLIVAGTVLIGGARTRNPKLFAGIATVAGFGTLILMLGGKFFIDKGQPPIAEPLEQHRPANRLEARHFHNETPETKILPSPAKNVEPFEPDLNKNWNSTYSTINWQAGWYGSTSKTIRITNQGWDEGLGRYVVAGVWGRTTSASMKGGFRFEFDTPRSFTGHWWYDSLPNNRNAWSGTR